MMSSGFVPPGTSRDDVAGAVAGAVGSVAGICAAIGIVSGAPVAEFRAAYPNTARWNQYGPPPEGESLMVLTLIGARRTDDDVQALIGEVHAAVAVAWHERWGETSAEPDSLPLDQPTWDRMRSLVTSWTESGCDDEELAAPVRRATRG